MILVVTGDRTDNAAGWGGDMHCVSLVHANLWIRMFHSCVEGSVAYEVRCLFPSKFDECLCFLLVPAVMIC